MNEADLMQNSQEAQRARAAMKATYDDNSFAHELLAGQEQNTPEFQTKRAEESAERAARIEALTQEIALLDDEIAPLQAEVDILDSIESLKSKKSKAEEGVAKGGEAASIYQKAIMLRESEIAELQSKLTSLGANPEIRTMLQDKISQKEATVLVRNSLLN